MDDVDWSDPAPRGRRATTELAPPSWVQAPEREPVRDRRHDGRRYERRDSVARETGEPERPRRFERTGPSSAVGHFHAEDYLDARDYAAEVAGANGWNAASAAEPVVIEYTDAAEEEIWGPRPKLHSSEPGGRRTVVITGRGSDRAVVPVGTPREGLPAHARYGFPADRTAMWAVLLCVIVLLAALASH